MRTVVIGASAAGGSLCETIRSLDSSAEITLVTDEPLPLYSRCLLPMYVDGDRTVAQLSFRPKDWPERLRIDVANQRAVKVSPESKRVTLANGESLPYDVLGLATGASAVIPDLPGINCRGVFALYTMQSAEAVRAWLPKVKRVAILGAGFIGMKSAEALSRLGKEVTIIVRRTHVLPNHLDDDAAAIMTEVLSEHGVHVVTRQTITEVLSGKNGELRGLLMSTGETLECGMLICASGIRPNLDLLSGSGVNIVTGVKVNDYLESSVPGIFATGDVAEAREIGTETMLSFANWRNSVREGRIAAYNMLREKTAYPGRLRANATRLFGLPVVVVGRPLVDAEDAEVSSDSKQKTYQKFVFHNGQLTGMILLGDTAEAGAFTSLMQQPRDLTPIRSLLLEERAGCLPSITLASLVKRP